MGVIWNLATRARRSTVRSKLTFGMTLIVAGISFFIFFYFPARLERQAGSALADKANSIAEAMAYAVSPALVFEDRQTIQRYLSEFAGSKGLFYVVVLDADGEVFAATRSSRAIQLDLAAPSGQRGGSFDRDILEATSPILDKDEVVGSLQLGLSLESLHREVAESRSTTALVSMLIFLVGIVVTYVMSLLVTRRLRRIARTAEAISAGDLTKRAPASDSDEVGELARSFNMMVEQVQAAYDALREVNRSLEVRVAERTSELEQEVLERRRAERELRASEERFRAMFESAGMGIVLLDGQGHVLKSNRAFQQFLGCSQERLRGQALARIAHAEDRLAIDKLLGELAAGMREQVQLEARFHKFGGLLMWSHVTISSVRSSDGKARFAIGVLDDITERKRLEQELEKAQRAALQRERGQRQRAEKTAEKLAYFPRMNPNPVVELTGDGHLIYVNEAAERLAEQVGAPNAAELLPPARADIVGECLASGEQCAGHEVAVGGRRLAWTFYPLQPNRVVYGYGFDITERIALESQLRESQKLEAVGRLAGGVAHDFNNVLLSITGLSELLLEDLGEGHPMREDLEEIKKAGDRAGSLTRQLLAFSRRQILKPVELDLNSVVTDMKKMLQRLIGEDVELVANLQPELSRIEADPGQVEQVLMNLAVNARDAMPKGGRLTIETRNLELDAATAQRLDGAAAGHYAMLAVSDTGIGMNEETRSRIFEPFFTTKEMGKGTGLGLATVYGIVKQTGGHIVVQSKLGVGTTFRILLPRLEESAELPETTAMEEAPLSGAETILLAEDDDAVRKMTARLLRKRGYAVVEAAHGAEALQISEQLDQHIDLLLTDVVMPQMNGRELAQQMVMLRPETPVIFMTGYTDDAIIHHGVIDSGIDLVQKPFKQAVLLEKVREVLDRKPMLVRGAA